MTTVDGKVRLMPRIFSRKPRIQLKKTALPAELAPFVFHH